MEITGFRFEQYTGRLEESPDEFYEERLARPIDLYDEFQPQADPMGDDAPDDHVPVTQTFLFVETDEGIEGMAGPLGRSTARRASTFESLLVGRDPMATEYCWDLMYRQAVHGRKGEPMFAISAIDVALWDLTGRALGEPVVTLLGGPTRRELPAYASMLRFPVEPDDVRERAAEYQERGFQAQKWFFRHGPGSGYDGMAANEALVAAAREAVGPDYDLMFDAWMSWDRPYAAKMLERVEQYDPRWVEEPVQPDKIDQYVELREETSVPIAGGEHEYTRWGMHELLSAGAVDVLQADTYWAGGITELRHACSLASVRDVPVIPHGHSVPANVHVVAAQPATVCPYVEYLVKHNRTLQLFFDDPVTPTDGTVTVPDRPGIGVDIDEDAIESRTELSFDATTT